MATWDVQRDLEKSQYWYTPKLEQGTVRESNMVKRCGTLNIGRENKQQLEYKDRKLDQIKDMACPPSPLPRDINVNEQVKHNLQKYQQLAFKIGERRPEYHIEVIPVVIGRMEGSANKLRKQKAIVLETDGK